MFNVYKNEKRAEITRATINYAKVNIKCVNICGATKSYFIISYLNLNNQY